MFNKKWHFFTGDGLPIFQKKSGDEKLTTFVSSNYPGTNQKDGFN
jgi:hypothetical protein